MPLNKRGWVFQEPVLSPRILHFAEDQVYFECREGTFSETCPAGLKNSQLEIAGVIPSTFHLPTKSLLEDTAEAIIHFFDFVTRYTICSLTYPDLDRFPAFAGVAEHFARETSDVYIAGHLRRQLPVSLLWVEIVVSRRAIDQPQSSVYRCPSWSWAKMTGTVALHPNFTTKSITHRWKLLVSVINVEATPFDLTNPFGRLNSAELVLRTRMLPLKTLKSKLDLLIKPSTLDFDAHEYVDTTSMFFLPVICESLSSWEKQGIRKKGTLGLVVDRVEGTISERYKRVGCIYLETRNNALDRLSKDEERDIRLVKAKQHV